MKESLALDGQLTTEYGVDVKQQRSSLTEYCISPYISGTFQGFEEEFKHLYTKVFPKLDALCQEKGLRFSPVCPRRAAVDTRPSSDLILTHALDKINHCSPFFMAVFGQQYGPHRAPHEPFLSARAEFGRQTWHSLPFMDRNLLNAGKHKHWWVLDNKWQYCSLLELEIQVAALEESSHAKHCLFYVRDFKHPYLKKIPENIYDYGDHDDDFVSGDGYSLFEAESPYAEKKLNDLKTRIAKKGWSIKFFSSAVELGDIVLQNWTNLINLLYPSPYFKNEFSDADRCNDISRCEREIKYHYNKDLKATIDVLNKHASKCKPINLSDDLHNSGQSEDLLSNAPEHGFDLFSISNRYVLPMKWDKQTQDIEKNILVLVGDPGSGKTSLIAKWMRKFEKDHPEILIISEFVGSSHASRDIGSFLRRCVKKIRELCGKRMTSHELLEDTKSYTSLVSAFCMCIKRVPCVIVIDSLNDLKPCLEEDIGSIKKMSWLPNIVPSNCKIILSTRRSDLTYKALSARKDVAIKWIPVLSKSDRISLLKSKLTHNVLSIGMTNADKLTGNRLSEKPLFLVTIAGLVSSCTSQREIDRVIERCTELRTYRDFWKTTFTLWTLRYSWKKSSHGVAGTCRTITSGWVSDSLRLIAASRNGLLVSEILHLLFLIGYKGKSTVTPYDWMLFQTAAKDAFSVQPEGYIMLAHTEIRHAVKYYLLGMALPTAMASAASLGGGTNLQQQFHNILANYFMNYGNMERKIIELPWQLEQAGDFIVLCQVMSKARFFEAFYKATKSHPHLMIDLIHYWEKLNDAGFSPSHYLQTMIERASEKTKSIFSLDYSWNPDSLGFGSLKTISTMSTSSLKRPSIAVTSTFGDIRRQSTVGTGSESGDFDLVSEAGNQSFFVTESEPKLDTVGWSPREENPEVAIDESQVDDDESCQLSYQVCIFLNQLGKNFAQDSKDDLLALSQLLLEMRPLSCKQQLVHAKTLSALAQFSIEDKNKDFVQCLCEEALEVIESLALQIGPRSNDLEELHEVKINACHLMAKLCIEKCDYKRAGELLRESIKSLKAFRSFTEELNLKFAFAKLYIAQGLYGQAESYLKEVLNGRLQWYGPSHICVGHVLHEMADLYATLEEKNLLEQKISLFAYKQAHNIYQKNSDKKNEASLLHKIGSQLKREGSFFTTQEARLCLENALDLYTTQIGPTHYDIPNMREDVRKLSVDLLRGRYEFGHAKPVDKRTDDFACSTMTWHDFQLRKMMKRRTLKSAPPTYGKPLSPAPSLAWKVSSPRPFSQGTIQTEYLPALGDDQSSVKVEVIPPMSARASQHADIEEETESLLLEEGKDTIIVPAGRESRISIKLHIKEGSEKSFSVKVPVIKKMHTKPLLEDQSEYSEYTDATTPRARIRHDIHRKHCHTRSGPDNISMTIHGSYSTIQSILDPPPSPRPNVRESGVLHKSAWYNVPGRYRIPGQILPPKHRQVRSECGTRVSSSRRSCRSFHSV